MKSLPTKTLSISRRRLLPLLGSVFLIPFFGFKNSPEKSSMLIINNEEYKTLLKPDGTIVKIKASSLKNAKIIKKNISNKSFLNWLGKKI
ncbi:hypothetical protein BX611_1842 [Lutibacter oceani]|uniref:Uncharacterized protein n=1 Tax=Lutibacter oceani TaxID=1853311 RepID=A0A3D9S091_9FLAO|nr:hypothetical protein [Lutibacter oceani]REE82295.1 hypothetical protein BX611_1842 [Lutibacter oceani]